METSVHPIIAIDGPAGGGKSSVGRAVARALGIPFVSSGAMYRAVAWVALREGAGATNPARLAQIAEELDVSFEFDSAGCDRVILSGEDVTDMLYSGEVAQVASIAAVVPEVRAPLVARQRALGAAGGIVMEGRDIQTVVFPDADIKLFVTASSEERARRRWKELSASGSHVPYADVLREVRVRDERDTQRSASPMRAAEDAITVDTDGVPFPDVVARILRLVEAWRRCPTLRGPALARNAGLGRGVL